MSETDILQGGAVAETAADSRARGRLPARCYACAAPVKGPYCYACGQKNDDCRRSIASLTTESVRDIASFEGRFLRTVRAVVMRPGRHLRDYGRGVRSPYSPPIRFFLVVSFAFFTTLWLTDRQIVAFQPEVHVNEDGELEIDEWAGGFFVKARDVTYTPEEREAMLGAVAAGTASDEVEAEVLRQAAEDEIEGLRADSKAEIAKIEASGGPDAGARAADVAAEAEMAVQEVRTRLLEDLAEVAPGEAGRAAVEMVQSELRAEGLPAPVIVDIGDDAGTNVEQGAVTVNGREIDADRLRTGLFRLAENPRLFNNLLAEWIPRIMILMIPLMALLGALFVRGPDALLYDHALLSLNTHALAFGLMTLGMWTAGFLPGWLFGWAVFLGVPFYYYRAMRGAFGRRRRKLIPATLVVFGIYGLVLTSALSTAAVAVFTETL